MGADAGAAELRVDRAAIGLAGEARLPDPATVRWKCAPATALLVAAPLRLHRSRTRRLRRNLGRLRGVDLLHVPSLNLKFHHVGRADE